MWIEEEEGEWLIRHRELKVPTHSDIHGNRFCLDTRRYFCVVCWRLVCWCKGGNDDVDQGIHDHYECDAPTGDAGICDECFTTLARGEDLTLEIYNEEDTHDQKAVS